MPWGAQPVGREALGERRSSVLNVLHLRGLLDIQVKHRKGSKKYKSGVQGRGLGWK